MDLYLIRHADARPLGEEDGQHDAERPLSPAGQRQAEVLGARLQKLEPRLQLMVTSPLLRARQTAEGALQAWGQPAPSLQTCAELAPGGKPKKLARYLREQGVEVIGLVGHMPDLGQLAAWLIGSKKAQVEMAKSGVAYIPCPEGPGKGAGSLVWLVTPGWLGLS
jgi:phosphohistidine phosphatase